MARNHLIAVGACAIDNILTVPHFPAEDSKLRALSLTKRRGGNCPNTLEVLTQLTNAFAFGQHNTPASTEQNGVQPNTPYLELSLIATLPARSSSQMLFIASSFGRPREAPSDDAAITLESSPVDLSRCIYREAFSEPISSYIICSQATSSRTIVNNNELPEMSFDEFVEATRDILASMTSNQDRDSDKHSITWFHFEGRIPQTTLQCIRHLRRQAALSPSAGLKQLRISVELEKPGREGLQELALEADVVFYSRSWAEAEGYDSIETCLKEQAGLLSSEQCKYDGGERLLVCTWSDQGAGALQLQSLANHSSIRQGCATGRAGNAPEQRVVHSQAYTDRERLILDTVGAGDTFIAGMLFGLICRSQDGPGNHDPTVALDGKALERQPVWSLKQKLDFANGLAGRKVLQQGFQGLGMMLNSLVEHLDHELRK